MCDDDDDDDDDDDGDDMLTERDEQGKDIEHIENEHDTDIDFQD